MYERWGALLKTGRKGSKMGAERDSQSLKNGNDFKLCLARSKRNKTAFLGMQFKTGPITVRRMSYWKFHCKYLVGPFISVLPSRDKQKSQVSIKFSPIHFCAFHNKSDREFFFTYYVGIKIVKSSPISSLRSSSNDLCFVF